MDHHLNITRVVRGRWAAVLCLSLMTFLLVASEFLPVSLLTPIARDLGITEGQTGQAIAVSGFFAVVTSLFGNLVVARIDRRIVVLLYTTVLLASGLLVTFAPSGVVFMVGRALVGIAVGGFWSLSTAIVARLVSAADLPKALALLQGGTALAAVIAAPAGSFLGGLVGWRGAFFAVVPLCMAGLVWQLLALPGMPARNGQSTTSMFRLLRNRTVSTGMVATTLAFMGQFSASTYFRPFLERVAGLDVDALSLTLLALGLAGLAGTSLVGFVLTRRLGALLVGLPLVLAVVSTLLIAFGTSPVTAALLLVAWGFFTTPIPVAWGTWMSRVIPDDLEAGGGLQVALIQVAITAGASFGGVMFDAVGWWSPFALGTVLLSLSAGVALVTAGSIVRRGRTPTRSPAVAPRDTWERALSGGLTRNLDWAALTLIEQVSPRDRDHRG